MIELKIGGMSCQHCVHTVDQVLAAVEGVRQVVEVRLDDGTAIVDGEPDVAALIAAVEEEGYTAEVRA